MTINVNTSLAVVRTIASSYIKYRINLWAPS